MMWGVVTVCLLLPNSVVFGQDNVNNFVEVDNRTVAADHSRNNFSKPLNEMKIAKFLDDIVDWTSSATEYFSEESGVLNFPQTKENGRKLKYKKEEFKFMMKTFLIFKVILGLLLPLGIIASKILSWKAVTFSLMALMLAKILFIKNLLSGKNSISVTPNNFVPPYFIQNGANDLFWKRQGEAQNAFTWTQTQV